MKNYLFLPLLFIFLSGCEKKFSSQEYFPLDKDFIWTFSGPFKEIKVAKVDTVASGTNYKLIYSDSLGVKAWEEEFIIREGNVYLRSYKSFTNLLPTVTFDPAIPITPISENRSEINVFTSTATHYDSTRQTYLIRVEYEIEEIETVETPAGTFDNCIKQKMAIIYEETPKLPLFEETNHWWFAKNIGPVKYSSPTDEGILHNAMLGPQKYPIH
jgi:hypothetical protein